ncbi:MAG: response regulator [Polyangiaceae bacterium]
MGRSIPTVLFVDDEQPVLDVLRRSLSDRPYRVLAATSAKDAFDLLAAEEVDVIVVDHDMPEMTGLGVLQRVRLEHPNVVRMMLTGHAALNLAKKAINDAEVFRFLEKPVMRDELWRALGDAMSSKERGVGGHSREPAVTDERLASLSPRERQVVRLVAGGLRVGQVADRLSISPHTVRNHLKSAFGKLDVHSQEELVEMFGRVRW